MNNPAPARAPRGRAAWLGCAETPHAQAIDRGLERVQPARNALGLLPRFAFVKVAGTHGKGSICAS